MDLGQVFGGGPAVVEFAFDAIDNWMPVAGDYEISCSLKQVT